MLRPRKTAADPERRAHGGFDATVDGAFRGRHTPAVRDYPWLGVFLWNGLYQAQGTRSACENRLMAAAETVTAVQRIGRMHRIKWC